MKKTVFTLLILLSLIFPFAALAAVGAKPVYQDTFVGELAEKYDRLYSLDEPKIVIIGGSSVAFGIDSAMMEAKLDMPVVNFGLYANLGTKMMIELATDAIGEGDIVILAPELNAQTLSLYFNAETAAQALDGNRKMRSALDADDRVSLIGASFRLALDKISYATRGTAPENTGAYSKEVFNEYGDNTFDRPYNVMTAVPKSLSFGFLVEDDGVMTEYEQFIDFVNAFCDKVSSRGADVYYSFAPMDEAALTAETDEESILLYYNNLRKSLHCRVISDPFAYLMDDGYFYDTVFHLNNAGVTVRTVNLIDDVKRERGDFTVTMAKADLPSPPGYAVKEILGTETENLFFLLNKTVDNSGEYWEVVGLNAQGKTQSTLTVPDIVDGIPVRSILPHAFDGAAVREILLGLNITRLEGESFAGAEALRKVTVPEGKRAGDISVPGTGDKEAGLALMTDGANSMMKIYVDASAYEDFLGEYSWEIYGSRIRSK